MEGERPHKRARLQLQNYPHDLNALPTNENHAARHNHHLQTATIYQYHQQQLPPFPTIPTLGLPNHNAERRRGMYLPPAVDTDHIVLDNHILSHDSRSHDQRGFTFRNTGARQHNTEGRQTHNSQPLEDWQKIANRAFAPAQQNVGSAADEATVQQYFHAHQQQETEQITRNGPELANNDPLAHLKLSAEAREAMTPPRLDEISAVHRVTDFLKPQTPLPYQDTPIYRHNFHKQHIPENTFKRTMPDQVESQAFIDDVLIDKAVRLTKHGDVPVLEPHIKRDRVPVRARDAPVDGEPMLYRPPTGFMPYHALAAANASKARRQNASKPAKPLSHQRKDLKRKRPTYTLPANPPSYRSDNAANFNIFNDGFLNHINLCLHLSANMTVQTLISLYSISKDFHTIINSRFTTVILNQLSLKAPAAPRAYHWRCFDSLSQPDPSTTSKHIINKAAPPAPPRPRITPRGYTFSEQKTIPRHTQRFPTLRYLQLAIHREKTIHALYHAFAARGVPLPGSPDSIYSGSFCLSLHKLWFIFDIPDNQRRVYYVRQAALISNEDLSNTLTFLVKLDMICHDPIGPEKRDGMRKLMMGSCKGLADVLRCIRGEIWNNELEVLRAWVRYGLEFDGQGQVPRGWVGLGLSEQQIKSCKSVFGVKMGEVGMLKKEFWGRTLNEKMEGVGKVRAMGRPVSNLLRPDQIVMREVVNRGMKFGNGFLRALLCGYVDLDTNEEIGPRDLNGGRSKVLEDEDEYDVDDAIAGMQALDVEEGGDELLDIGSTWKGSPWTVKHKDVSLKEVNRRIAEERQLEENYAAWRSEVEEELRYTRANSRYTVVIDESC